jgi:hypothetical protein
VKLCKKCKKAWRSGFSRKFRKFYYSLPKADRKKEWPLWIYHSEPGRLCRRHHVENIAHGAKRRASKLNQTPIWSDLDNIKLIYARAKEIEKETGVKMHVDHIIPLQGKNVRGLHVSWNLQIIRAELNIQKNNKFNA